MNREDTALIENNAANYLQATNDSHADEGLGRREWLKSVGGLGLGLFGIALPSFGQEIKKVSKISKLDHCPHMLRLSKGLTAEIRKYICKPCKCKDERVFKITFEFKGLLTSYNICDKSQPMIPNQCTMKGSLVINLLGGECSKSGKPILWGCHKGKFMLFGLKTERIFEGTLSGTFGVDPRTSGEDRCCWPYGSGYLQGKGIDKFKGCTLCSTYLLKVPFNQHNPCTKTPPKELAMQFDGMLMCPC